MHIITLSVHKFIDEVTGSAIHGLSGKRTSDTKWIARDWYLGDDRIAGRKWSVHVPAWRKIFLKKLSKAGFDKQPLSYGGFGAGRPCHCG
jgi:hypothetical protein